MLYNSYTMKLIRNGIETVDGSQVESERTLWEFPCHYRAKQSVYPSSDALKSQEQYGAIQYPWKYLIAKIWDYIELFQKWAFYGKFLVEWVQVNDRVNGTTDSYNLTVKFQKDAFPSSHSSWGVCS